ncbi:MAG: hypothetical protein ACI4XB_09790 [Ruminococcus sp.]
MDQLKSIGKVIDTRPIRYIATEGEKNADTICIRLERYYCGVDLSACTFALRGVNANGEIAEQVLTKRTEDDLLLLQWQITDIFTAVPGQMQLELRGMLEDEIVIKYRMPPVTIQKTLKGTGVPTPDMGDQLLMQMEQMLDTALELTAKMPLIQNGTWWLYNGDTGEYEDSGQPVQGADGQDGAPGADGFSPTATVEKSGSVATITITDKNGTTTATVRDGEDADLSRYATVAYVDDQIQAVNDVTNEIESDVKVLEDTWHTHTNTNALQQLTLGHIEKLNQTFPQQIYALQQSLGDIQTALADIVEVTE